MWGDQVGRAIGVILARDDGLNQHGNMVHGRSFNGVATHSKNRGGLNGKCVKREVRMALS